MKKVNFGSTVEQVPAIVMGCMRMKELSVKEAAELVDTAMAEGVNFLTTRIFTEEESVKNVLKRRQKRRT